MKFERRHGLIVIALLTSALGLASRASAQPPFGLPGLPFADPQRMFEQFFGEDSPADRELLATIDVSVEEEQQFGEEILRAGLASFQQSGVKIATKGPRCRLSAKSGRDVAASHDACGPL